MCQIANILRACQIGLMDYHDLSCQFSFSDRSTHLPITPGLARSFPWIIMFLKLSCHLSSSYMSKHSLCANHSSHGQIIPIDYHGLSCKFSFSDISKHSSCAITPGLARSFPWIIMSILLLRYNQA